MPLVKPGDIVLKYRPKYSGPFRYFIQRAICWFTTEWWTSEHTSTVSHAEMVCTQIDDQTYRVIDEEPPKVRLKVRGFNRRIIFRLKDKPENFNEMFDLYCEANFGKKYEYWKLFLFILDWIFHTGWFSKHWDVSHYYVCSEFVAYFYHVIGHPCSGVPHQSTSPDDIYDFCRENPELFDLISDQW